jgi:hypothetical protein
MITSKGDNQSQDFFKGVGQLESRLFPRRAPRKSTHILTFKEFIGNVKDLSRSAGLCTGAHMIRQTVLKILWYSYLVYFASFFFQFFTLSNIQDGEKCLACVLPLQESMSTPSDARPL